VYIGSLLDDGTQNTSHTPALAAETVTTVTDCSDVLPATVADSITSSLSDVSNSYHVSSSLVQPQYCEIMVSTGDGPPTTDHKFTEDYQQSSQPTASSYQLDDDVRPFYQRDEGPSSSPQRHNNTIELGEPPVASRGFPYSSDGLSGTYPLPPVRSDGPLQSLEGLASDSSTYMPAGVDTPRPPLIDSASSYSMSLPPYPAAEVDQSKIVGRIPSYLPYAAAQRTIESPAIYGRSVPPVTPAFPSDTFTKDFFGQYLQETSSGPLHALATHDQHAAAAAGLLTGYQQSSTLPTMPQTSAGSELFRRAYSGVSDNIFGGMKSPAQSTFGVSQPQQWMAVSDPARHWNHTPPDPVSRYTYPSADTGKPMSKRPDDVAGMFMSTSSASVHYPGPRPPPYPHPSLNSTQRQLEDAYRQMAAGDYRSLAHHRTPSDMYGSALSSLDRYYYTARDAMYRSHQLAAAAMPHPFISQTSQYTATVPDRGREYAQCPTPAYGFMCPPPSDKQYLPASSSAAVRTGDYLDNSQDSYSRIYNMMPRYF